MTDLNFKNAMQTLLKGVRFLALSFIIGVL
jgi:hypothetical protein